MFGVGPQEMAMVALFALIIFGPGKLPEVMREAGKHYRKFKGMADEMTGELNKVTAEARKELDGAFGELGPDMQKSLGLNNKTTSTASRASTSTAKKSTTSTSTAKKTTTTASTAKKTGTGSSTAAKSTSSTTAPAATKTSTKAAVASKDDPFADFAAFEAEVKPATKRVRSATPSAITDFTPRMNGDVEPSVDAQEAPLDVVVADDALSRARARRRTAGYARA